MYVTKVTKIGFSQIIKNVIYRLKNVIYKINNGHF